MLASPGVLPTGPGWVYEFKWDGIRAIAVVLEGRTRLFARSGAEVTAAYPELATVVETVLLLRYTELRSQLYRLVSIMKMRESRYDTSIREFQITDHGIRVASSFESAEAILTGHARLADGAKGGGS